MSLGNFGFPDGTVIREFPLASSAGRKRRSSEFIYCDDPQSLRVAASLSSKALIVMLLVQHRSRVAKCDWITLPQHMLDAWGVSSSTKSRAIAALSDVGLIETDQSVGCTARLRLVGRKGH